MTMNDERVDALLKDLDAALSVQPSPSVAARVRSEIAERRTQGLTLLPRLIFGAAMIAAVAATYAVWPRSDAATSVVERATVATAPREVANNEPEATARPLVTAAPRSNVVTTTQESPAAPSRVAGAERREPEVLVSPSVRIGLEQLQAAVAAGRITAESLFAKGQVEFEPTIVIPSVVVLQPFEIDTVPADAASLGPSGAKPASEPIPISLISPPARTRSVL